jgi:hypothetical protein
MTLEAALHAIRIACAIVALLYAVAHPVAPVGGLGGTVAPSSLPAPVAARR